MSYAVYLRELLRPLGIYDLAEGSLSGSELDALGLGMDGAEDALEYTEQESLLSTACGEGLDRREASSPGLRSMYPHSCAGRPSPPCSASAGTALP